MWINGAFGVGKTQTAFELHRRLTDPTGYRPVDDPYADRTHAQMRGSAAHVADPELIGFAIRKMLPPAQRGDFQDRPQWRAAVVATLVDAVAAHAGPVIVPMTLVNSDYFDEIMNGLAAKGVEVRHFALIASAETLHRRLRTRSSYWLGRADTWAMRQIPRCVGALAGERFAEHIPTDNRRLDDVVEDIAARLGLPLAGGRLHPARYQLRRAAVGIRHIRL